MRTLLLFRGAPGCGKSTYIDEHGLRPYTLSADEIRLQCQSPVQNPDGTVSIGMNDEKTTWNTLFTLLETRMKNGEFTVIDATNSKSTEMNKYKKLKEKYNYRIFCIDMTDLPIDECKRRNAQREILKRVPEDAIDKMYARFENQNIPSGITALKPDELDKVWMKKLDFSSYKKIVHIGDIHGCYSALMKYFENGLDDDALYIFLGDLIDRGIENAEVVKFLLEIANNKNVLILEGNHENWLKLYSHGERGKSKEFELNTRKQLDEAHFNPKELRQLCRKFCQCAWYQYDDKEVFVSHGGIATMPENITKFSTSQLIKGVGMYDDCEKIADIWMESTSGNVYQIYGHRNTKGLDLKVRDRVFNLEGKVEFGGHLRIVELSHDGFKEIEIKNDIYKIPDEENTEVDSNIADLVLDMRANKYINEKEFGNFSSFNFSQDAFRSDVWNKQTILARGLFIDTNRMKVAARSYNKFFNIDQRPETKFDMLQNTFTFPVTCYVKENGFLGIISYDEYNDDFLITSKSCVGGKYADYIKIMFENNVSLKHREMIKEYIKENDVSFVFECVDQENDPHIIEYEKSDLYLLSIIRNDIQFSQYNYDELKNLADKFGLTCKEKAYEIFNWQEFFDWYYKVLDENYTFNGRIIEGFVIEDSAGFMTKLKLSYYNFWKKMRAIASESLRKGYVDVTSRLFNAESNEFYAFIQYLYDNVNNKHMLLHNFKNNIIELRNMFYEYKKGSFDMDKMIINRIEKEVRTHEFYCSICNKFLGKSTEYEDGYYEEYGNYDDDRLNIHIHLCDECREKVNEKIKNDLRKTADEVRQGIL